MHNQQTSCKEREEDMEGTVQLKLVKFNCKTGIYPALTKTIQYVGLCF